MSASHIAFYALAAVFGTLVAIGFGYFICKECHEFCCVDWDNEFEPYKPHQIGEENAVEGSKDEPQTLSEETKAVSVEEPTEESKMLTDV